MYTLCKGRYYIAGEQIKKQDDTFRAVESSAASLDPIGFGEDFEQDLAIANAAGRGEVCTNIYHEVLNRAIEWAASRPIGEYDPATRAVVRDTDRVIGSIIAHFGEAGAQTLELSQWSSIVLEHGLPSPRGNIYDYSWGSRGVADSTKSFTRDEREQELITVFDSSLKLAHNALWKVLEVREKINSEDKVDLKLLEEAIQYVKATRDRLPIVYRKIGAAFVAMRLFPYFRGYHYKERFFEGANPSHSAFYILDRLVLGNFEHLSSNPVLGQQLEYRTSDLPTHLQQLLKVVENSGFDKSLKHHVREDPEAVILAGELTHYLWQMKHVHKSFADTGLKARRKRLTPDEPDLLSDLVAYAKEKK